MTSEKDEIVKWIAGLADPDPLTREVSALRIYLAGGVLYSLAISKWFADAEFRELVRPFPLSPQGQPDPSKEPYTVGIAVKPETFERIHAAFGSPRLAEVPPDQDAKEFELRFANAGHFDILTTREPGGSGAIARFLEKFGEGIQQIEVNVTDIDRATEILRTRFGVAPIYPATRPGADGTRVNFFLVPAPNGAKLLIELVEPAAKK